MSTAYLLSIADLLSDGVLSIEDGLVVEVNSAFVQLAGYGREFLVGKPVSSFLTNLDWEQLEGLTSTHSIEADLRTSWGEVFGVLVARLVSDPQSSSECLLIKPLQSELLGDGVSHYNARYQAVVEDLPNFVTRFLPGGYFTFVSRSLCEFWGKKPSELLGTSWYTFLDAKQLADIEVELAKLTPENPAYTNIQSVRMENGDLCWQEWTNRAIFDRNRQIVEFQGVGRDITAQRKQEEALRLSEQRLALVVESSNVGFWDWDILADKVYWSPRLLAMFGYQAYPFDEYRGSDITFFSHPLDLEPVNDALVSLVNGEKESIDIDHRFLKADGTYLWINTRAKAIRTNKGRDLQRVIGVAVDIQQQKFIEDTLREGRMRAEHAARVKSEFIASVSHELRTPLNGIIGMLGLIPEDDLSRDCREKLTVVRSSAQTLLSLVADLLDFSKAEAGQLSTESFRFDLRDTVEHIEALLAPQAYEKQVNFSTFITRGVQTLLLGDETRIRQVLVNLVGNAIKFTEPGGTVAVTVSETHRDEYLCRLRFEVQDTGIGISQDRIADLFQPFSQVYDRRRHNYGGTGLGLAISKKVVDALGGTIGVESLEGFGANFWFEIPMVRAVQPLSGPEMEREAPSPLPPNKELRSLRVLVAEDNDVNRLVVEGHLNRMGHEVVSVPDGSQVVPMLGTQHFDLILMDLQMPVMDGYQATAAVREWCRQSQRTLPVIAFTAFTHSEDRNRCLQAGMDGFITKPFSETDFLRQVAELCPQFLYDVAARQPKDFLLSPAQQLAPRSSPQRALAEYLNLSELELAFGGNRVSQRDLFSIFLRQTPLRLARLEAAISAGDIPSVVFEAHTLMGSARSLFYRTMAESFGRIENLASTGAPQTELEAAFAVGLQDFHSVQPLLEQVLAPDADS